MVLTRNKISMKAKKGQSSKSTVQVMECCLAQPGQRESTLRGVDLWGSVGGCKLSRPGSGCGRGERALLRAPDCLAYMSVLIYLV